MKIILFTIIFFLCYLIIHAQIIQISGKVIDAKTKKGMPSVSIKINATKGYITDVKGNFYFKANEENFKNATVRFSYIGYSDKYLKYKGEKNWIIEMTDSSS